MRVKSWEKDFDRRFPCPHHAVICDGSCRTEEKEFIKELLEAATPIDAPVAFPVRFQGQWYWYKDGKIVVSLDKENWQPIEIVDAPVEENGMYHYYDHCDCGKNGWVNGYHSPYCTRSPRHSVE